MNSYFKLLLFCLLLTCSNSYAGQSGLQKSLQLVVGDLSSKGVTGNILISDDQKIIFSATIQNNDLQLKQDSQFLIASITKQFTAVAILKLVEEKRLDLFKPIIEYIPATHPMWQHNPPDWIKKITIHHLLTHSSGLAEYVKLPNFDQFYKSHHDTFELIRFFAFHPLSFEPGTKYNYSGSGYNLLGAIIEIVTNKPYKKYLEEIFFSPLGMDSTQVIDVLDYQLPNLAAGHILEKDGIKLSSKVNLSTAFSEAAIVSNILDLQKWSRNLYQGKIINRNSLKIMHKNYLQTNNNSYIGYGVFIDNNYAIKPIYQHTGRINGYQSVLIHIPERNINIIILSNVMGWEMKPQIKHIIQLLNDL